MPFLTRNENQSQARYAAPATPSTPSTTGAPATMTTPAPIPVAAAMVPLRLATTLLRWTKELTSGGCTTNYPLSNVCVCHAGHDERGCSDTHAANNRVAV